MVLIQTIIQTYYTIESLIKDSKIFFILDNYLTHSINEPPYKNNKVYTHD